MAINNPFNFKHVTYLRGMLEFNDSVPCVVLASPGMLQNGLSRELFELWCSDSKNGVIIAGYAVEGTLAKELLSEPDQVPSLSGRILQRKCSIDYVSFSAHADYHQFWELVYGTKPKHIVLVHGEASEMMRLRNGLMRDLADYGMSDVSIFTPKNCTTLTLNFKGDMTAKIIGSLATEFENSSHLNGIIIRKGFSYRIMSKDDLVQYTDLVTTNILQSVDISYPNNSAAYSLLIFNLSVLSNYQIKVEFSDSIPSCILVLDMVNIIFNKNSLTIKWKAGSSSDMVADSVIAVISETKHNFAINPSRPVSSLIGNSKLTQLLVILRDIFGEDSVSTDGEIDKDMNFENFENVFILLDDDTKATINILSRTVECSSNKIKECLENILINYMKVVEPFCCNSCKNHVNI